MEQLMKQSFFRQLNQQPAITLLMGLRGHTPFPYCLCTPKKWLLWLPIMTGPELPWDPSLSGLKALGSC